jgi:hypothetical protein
VVTEIEDAMNPNKAQLLMDFFRVFGNEKRLRIAVQLIDQSYTARELAERFALKEPAVLESLAAMRLLNLVRADEEHQPARYSFDVKALYALNKAILSRETLPSPVDGLESEEDRKTLRPYFNRDRLTEIPVNGKKFAVLLKWLITQFEVGTHYTEKQVNEIIIRYHEDYATLRRGLIDACLMQREKGMYWRVSV